MVWGASGWHRVDTELQLVGGKVLVGVQSGLEGQENVGLGSKQQVSLHLVWHSQCKVSQWTVTFTISLRDSGFLRIMTFSLSCSGKPS